MSDATRASSPPVSTRSSSARAEFEFSEADKESFAALSASMSILGVCVMLLALLWGVVALVVFYSGFVAGGVGLVAGAALCVLMGAWAMSGGRSLSALVRTRGRDVEHLMAAVRQLRRMAVGMVAVALLVAAAAAGMVWCTFLADKGGRCFAGWG
jgi:hypothetical protein